MATTQNRYKRNLEKLNTCAKSGRVLWIVDPNGSDLYSTSGTSELTQDCLNWIHHQRDTLNLLLPRPILVPMERLPSSYMILAWKMSSKVATLSLSSTNSFWKAVKEAQENPYFYPENSLLKDFDLVVLPDHMTMHGIISIADAHSCLSMLTSSHGCAFLPGLQEYFEVADKYAVHSRLKWKLPLELNVKNTSVYVTKLPSIPIINVNQAITATMVIDYKTQLDALVLTESKLYELLEEQDTRGYVLKGRYGGCAVNVHIFRDIELTHSKIQEVLSGSPDYDFFLEPYLECLKNLEHRVYQCGDNQSWLVDTITSSPGKITSNLMKKDCITDMLQVHGEKVIFSISKHPLKRMILDSVTRKVKEVMTYGRGLLFNSAERLMIRVDLTLLFDDDGENCIAVINEIDQFNTAFLFMNDDDSSSLAKDILDKFSELLKNHIILILGEKNNKLNTRKVIKGM